MVQRRIEGNILKGIQVIVISLCLLICSMENMMSCYARTLSIQTTDAERNDIANNWIYWERGYADYNCLAYALGYEDRWIWPWSGYPSIGTVKKYLKDNSYTVSESSSILSNHASAARKIVVYENGSGITHFAKAYSAGTITAKWGGSEVFFGNKYDSYTDYLYGSPCLYAYRNVC